MLKLEKRRVTFFRGTKLKKQNTCTSAQTQRESDSESAQYNATKTWLCEMETLTNKNLGGKNNVQLSKNWYFTSK